MSTLYFYRTQALQQQLAADAATLENVRERCQRAADAWMAFALRSERAEAAREHALSAKRLLEGLNENPDRGRPTQPHG